MRKGEKGGEGNDGEKETGSREGEVFRPRSKEKTGTTDNSVSRLIGTVFPTSTGFPTRRKKKGR